MTIKWNYCTNLPDVFPNGKDYFTSDLVLVYALEKYYGDRDLLIGTVSIINSTDGTNKTSWSYDNVEFDDNYIPLMWAPLNKPTFEQLALCSHGE
jgi:hypothetical protein